MTAPVPEAGGQGQKHRASECGSIRQARHGNHFRGDIQPHSKVTQVDESWTRQSHGKRPGSRYLGKERCFGMSQSKHACASCPARCRSSVVNTTRPSRHLFFSCLMCRSGVFGKDESGVVTGGRRFRDRGQRIMELGLGLAAGRSEGGHPVWEYLDCAVHDSSGAGTAAQRRAGPCLQCIFQTRGPSLP